MKGDYATNSHFLTRTFLFKRLGECNFFVFVKQCARNVSIKLKMSRTVSAQTKPAFCLSYAAPNTLKGKSVTYMNKENFPALEAIICRTCLLAVEQKGLRYDYFERTKHPSQLQHINHVCTK